MKKTFTYFLLVFAIILAVITRGYKLGEAPAGLYLDEAGQGYSAYSILLTGKDEFGKSLPVVFRNFTDFKTPVYIYLIVPLIPIFGLTPLTIRLPSFIFSILTIPIFYFLISKLLRDKNKTIPLLSALLLAISPWHVLFGRTNFECNVALFFFLSGALTFYKGLKKPSWLILSAILFAIAIPAYHAQRIVTPLFLIIATVRFRKSLFSKSAIRYTLIGGIFAFIILIPTIIISFTPGFLARAAGLNIFSYQNHLPYGYIPNLTVILQIILNNKVFLTTREFLSLYFSYFSPRYMFDVGDYGPRSSFPNLATFFVWQFPFYIVGLWQLIKKKDYGELKEFTLIMFFISPIPAALTRDPYTTIRALQLVIPQIIVIAIGIYESYKLIWSLPVFHKLSNLWKRHISMIVLGIFIAYSILRLYSSVIILNEYYRPQEWNYGWKETVEVIQTLNPDLPIVVDTARGEPYIELLFFLKYPPETYAKDNFEVTNEEYYYKTTRRGSWNIDRITVTPIRWEDVLQKEQYLVGDALAISDDQIQRHNLTIIHDTLYPDKTIAQRIVKTNP